MTFNKNDLSSNITVNSIQNTMRGAVRVISAPLNSDIEASIQPIIHSEIDASIIVSIPAIDEIDASIIATYSDTSEIEASIQPQFNSEISAQIKISYYNLMRAKVGIISSLKNNDIDASIEPILHDDIDASINVRATDYDYVIGSIYVVNGTYSEINASITPVFNDDLNASIKVSYYNKMTVNVNINEPPKVVLGLNPIKDAFVRNDFPIVNYGNETDILIGNSNSEKFRSLLQFSLDTIPINMTIDKAELVLSHATLFDTQFTIELYNLISSWEEYNVTWNNQPSMYTKILEGSSGIGYSNITLDLTSVVNEWYSNTVDNNGILIKSKNETIENFVRYFSREGNTPPVLNVTYYDPLVRLNIGKVFLDSSITARCTSTNDLDCSITPTTYDEITEKDATINVILPYERDCSITVQKLWIDSSITVRLTRESDLDSSISIKYYEDLDASIDVSGLNHYAYDEVTYSENSLIGILKDETSDFLDKATIELVNIDILNFEDIVTELLLKDLKEEITITDTLKYINQFELFKDYLEFFEEFYISKESYYQDSSEFIDNSITEIIINEYLEFNDVLLDLLSYCNIEDEILITDNLKYINQFELFNDIFEFNDEFYINKDSYYQDSYEFKDNGIIYLSLKDEIYSEEIRKEISTCVVFDGFYSEESINIDKSIVQEELITVSETISIDKELFAFDSFEVSDISIVGPTDIDIVVIEDTLISLYSECTLVDGYEFIDNAYLIKEFKVFDNDNFTEEHNTINVLVYDDILDLEYYDTINILSSDIYSAIETTIGKDFQSFETVSIQENNIINLYLYDSANSYESGIIGINVIETIMEEETLPEKYLLLQDDFILNEVVKRIQVNEISDLNTQATVRVRNATEINSRIFVHIPQDIVIDLDTVPPENPSILLADGIVVTKNQLIPVELETTDADTTGYMMKLWGDVSEEYDPNIQSTEVLSQWIPYAQFSYVMLSGFYDYKVIYAKIRDEVGNETFAVSDDVVFNKNIDDLPANITARAYAEEFLGAKLFVNTGESSIGLIFDTSPPQDVEVTLNWGINTTRDDYIHLQITTSDVNTTGYWMKIWGDVNTYYDPTIYPNIEYRIRTDEHEAPWMPYEEFKYLMLSSGSGTKTIYVVMMDDVGNEAGIATDTLFYEVDFNPYSKSNVKIETAEHSEVLIEQYETIILEDIAKIFLNLDDDILGIENFINIEIPVLDFIEYKDYSYISLSLNDDIFEDSNNVISLINLKDDLESKDNFTNKEFDSFELLETIEKVTNIELINLSDYGIEDSNNIITLINLEDKLESQEIIIYKEFVIYEDILFKYINTYITIDEVAELSNIDEDAWIEIIYLRDSGLESDRLDTKEFNSLEFLESIDKLISINLINIEDINGSIDRLIRKEFNTLESGIEQSSNIISLIYLTDINDVLESIIYREFNSLDLLDSIDRLNNIELINLQDIISGIDDNKQIDLIFIKDDLESQDIIIYKEFNSLDFLESIDTLNSITLINLQDIISSIDKSIQIDLIYLTDINNTLETVIYKEFNSFELFSLEDIISIDIVDDEIVDLIYLDEDVWIEIITQIEYIEVLDNIISKEVVSYDLFELHEGNIIFGFDYKGRDFSYPGDMGGVLILNPEYGMDILPSEYDYPLIPGDEGYGLPVEFRIDQVTDLPSKFGYSGETITRYVIGNEYAKVYINYNMYDVPDAISILHNGITVNYGELYNQGTVEYEYIPVNGIDYIDVIINSPSGSTWEYTINYVKNIINPNYTRPQYIPYCKHPTREIPNPKYGFDILPTDSDYSVNPNDIHYGETVHVLHSLPAGRRLVDGYYDNQATNSVKVETSYSYVGYGIGNITIDCLTADLWMYYSEVSIYHDDTLLYHRESYELTPDEHSPSQGFIDVFDFDTTLGSPYLKIVATCGYYVGYDPYGQPSYYARGKLYFDLTNEWVSHIEVLPTGYYYDEWFKDTPRSSKIIETIEQPLPCDSLCDSPAIIKLYSNADWLLDNYDWNVFQNYPIEELYNLLVNPTDYTINYQWIFGTECIEPVDKAIISLLSEDSIIIDFFGYLSYKEFFVEDIVTFEDIKILTIVTIPELVITDDTLIELNIRVREEDIYVIDSVTEKEIVLYEEFTLLDDKATIWLFNTDNIFTDDNLTELNIVDSEDGYSQEIVSEKEVVLYDWTSWNEDKILTIVTIPELIITDDILIELNILESDEWYFIDKIFEKEILIYEYITLLEDKATIGIFGEDGIQLLIKECCVQIDLIDTDDFIVTEWGKLEKQAAEWFTLDDKATIGIPQYDTLEAFDSLITLGIYPSIEDIHYLDNLRYWGIEIDDEYVFYFEEHATITIPVLDDIVLDLKENGWIDILVWDYLSPEDILKALDIQFFVYDTAFFEEISYMDMFIGVYEELVFIDRCVQIDLSVWDSATSEEKKILIPISFTIKFVDLIFDFNNNLDKIKVGTPNDELFTFKEIEIGNVSFTVKVLNGFGIEEKTMIGIEEKAQQFTIDNNSMFSMTQIEYDIISTLEKDLGITFNVFDMFTMIMDD